VDGLGRILIEAKAHSKVLAFGLIP